MVFKNNTGLQRSGTRLHWFVAVVLLILEYQLQVLFIAVSKGKMKLDVTSNDTWPFWLY